MCTCVIWHVAIRHCVSSSKSRTLIHSNHTCTDMMTLIHCNHTCTYTRTLFDVSAATHCNTLQHTTTHCNTLQHTVHTRGHSLTYPLQHTATHCNTLQHTATHCNTLQHTATHCNALQHTATHCNTLYIHEDTLWRICCNTLQHTVHTRGHSLTYPLTEEIILQIFGSPDPYRNPVRSFERRGLRLLTWNFVANFGDSRDNVFDMYGDSRENLLEILAVVINFSTISPVRGYMCDLHTPRVEWRGLRGNGNAQSWSFLYLQISVDLSGNLWR